MDIFEILESNVRSYSRDFPAVFAKADGAILRTEDDKDYIDFWSGAGALNYGHNNPRLRRRMIDYIEGGGITHALDLSTTAKRDFLERFDSVILRPRRLEYKVQFTGPTGTNAVEAALKLARKVTGRPDVMCFTNAYHGMSMGSLALTGNACKRAGAGVPMHYAVRMPFDGFLGKEVDTISYVEKFLDDSSSGIDLPAAIIVESIQAEGGVKAASIQWLQDLERTARERKILLIADEIQVGCGRTGPFFSFEEAGLHPDIVCLSKSISGYGLPMAIILIRPDLDIWKPGEHNGTFRGNNLAFITGAEALSYWETDELSREVARKAEVVRERFEVIAKSHAISGVEVRGRGLIQGLAFQEKGVAAEISRAAFDRHLVIEAVGTDDKVLKLLPNLLIEDQLLKKGLEIIEESVATVMGRAQPASRTAA